MKIPANPLAAFTSDRQVAVIGTVASILGLCVSIFTQYKFASLISLLIFETSALIIWVHYVRQRNTAIFPYAYEYTLIYHRYTYNTQTEMDYEVLMILKVTCSMLSELPIPAWWYGSGTIAIKDLVSGKAIGHKVDGTTKQIFFHYPLDRAYRFDEAIVVRFFMKLHDPGDQELPELSKRIDRPTQLYISEVCLKYKEDNPAATLSTGLMSTDLHNPFRIIYQPLDKAEFDKVTKTYRAVFTHPKVGYIYRMDWQK